MKRKILISAGLLLLLWAVMFCTDYFRCSQMQPPVFALHSGVAADDGGSTRYIGLGYTVYVAKGEDSSGSGFTRYVQMNLLGFPCFRAIGCS